MSAVARGSRVEVREPEPEGRGALGFLWLEITGKCQLACEHCYAESGPLGSHGSMSAADWLGVIDQAAVLGVPMVQFIGGEPTLHPNLPAFVERALGHGIAVEVFSNLAHVSPVLWEVFGRPGVQLATSWYSDDPVEHERITKGRGSYQRTLDGIVEALRRDIPLRVGVIGLSDDQRVEEACRLLAELGVSDVGVDHMRAVGRGQRTQQASIDALCGNCANGVLAISPTGAVWPCVFARWMTIGNVKQQSLADILHSRALTNTRAELEGVFASRRPRTGEPDGPQAATDCRPDHPCDPEWLSPPNQNSGSGPLVRQVEPAAGPCNPRPCRPGQDCRPTCRPMCVPANRATIGRPAVTRARCVPDNPCPPGAVPPPGHGTRAERAREPCNPASGPCRPYDDCIPTLGKTGGPW